MVYRVVGAYRTHVAHPVSHTHLFAVGTVVEPPTKYASTLAWTAQDLERECTSTNFMLGSLGDRTAVAVVSAKCTVCGEDVVRVLPEESSRRLPECFPG